MTTTVATPTDLSKLQAQIDALVARVTTLEAQVAAKAVDGGAP